MQMVETDKIKFTARGTTVSRSDPPPLPLRHPGEELLLIFQVQAGRNILKILFDLRSSDVRLGMNNSYKIWITLISLAK